MNTNREMLDELFRTGRINLLRGAIFDTAPGPMPRDLDFGKVEGMMLGLAIGDGLGNTSEGRLPSARRAWHGEIRDFLPHRRSPDRLGLPTDDTQLAFRTLEQMLADDGLNPGNLAVRFCSQHVYGLGGTVSQFMRRHAEGLPWQECGPESAGNGALMRIAPMVIPHLRTGTTDLWVDTALAAMLTHNDCASTSACLAFVRMLWLLLQRDRTPDSTWFLEQYVETARDLEGEASYRARGGDWMGWEGSVWQFVAENLLAAYDAGVETVDACNSWHSGAYLLETVPCVLYILMRHAGDPEEAIVRAVNDTKDNDTVAAIVGAAVGALHGVERIPQRWVSEMSGRTAENDDGRVFELLAEARRRWWD